MRTPFVIPPGVVSDDTTFAATGRWADGNNMRPWRGSMQTIGGWSLLTNGLSGRCRAVMPWTDNDGVLNIAFGTHTHLYVHVDGTLADITPATFTPGAQDGAGAPGYGAGPYGDGGYGESPIGSYFPLTWSLARWGEQLLACPRHQSIFLWANNPASVATRVANAPDNISYMLVTPERQVLAFGCNEELSDDYNPMCIRGCDLEDIDDWTTSPSNNAFEHILEGSGRIVAAHQLGPYVAVWTDSALYLGEFIGATEQAWRFDRVADNCGLIGPNAKAVINQSAYWITPDGQIYVWSPGQPPMLAGCTIRNDFKDNLASGQYEKIVATTLGQYGEIWWFYPDSRDGLECSRYIALSTIDGTWFRGRIARSAASDSGPTQYPLFVTPDGSAYWHENGNSADGAPLSWMLRSADQYVEEGQRAVMIRAIYPDFEDQQGPVTLKLRTRQYPQGNSVREKGPYQLGTNRPKRDFRATGRVIQAEFSGSSSPAFVRFGKPSFDVVVTGER